MTVRTAPSARPVRSSARAAARPPAPAPDPAAAALDEALDHIGDLAERLWAVRRLHRPEPRAEGRRGLLRARAAGAGVRCSGCGHALPCPTLQAVDPAA